jgi:2-methylcitrate dehydratase PrpD
MEMRMKDGVVYRSEVDYTKGLMESPMTEGERKDKFNTLASAILSTEKRKIILSIVERLEEPENLSKLYELLY